MPLRTAPVLAFAFVVLLSPGVFHAQAPAAPPENSVRITGRIVSTDGTPMPAQTIRWRQTAPHPLPESAVATDSHGRFAISIPRNTVCQLTLTLSPESFANIAAVDVAEGAEASFGDVRLDALPGEAAVAHLSGPVLIGGLSSGEHTPSVAAIYIAPVSIPNEYYEGGVLHLLLSDGQDVQPDTDKGQLGSSSPLIAPDRRHAAWLADFPNCCTSYPLSRALVLYRPGKPNLRLTGDGRAIFAWHFLAQGKQVAFYQDFPHGKSDAHYELHDTDNGMLLGNWDGDITATSPVWLQPFKP